MEMTDYKRLTNEELSELVNQLRGDSSLVTKLAEAGRELISRDDYSKWFSSTRLEGKPFTGTLAQIFMELGLADLTGLRLQVHAMRDGIFLTDTPAIGKEDFVYPYQRESVCAYESADKHGLYQWGTIWFDLACGCGNHLLSLSRQTLPSQRYLFDVNDRALAYARINTIVNQLDDLATITKNDIRDGIPEGNWNTSGKNTVFLVNMPFNISAAPGDLPQYADGGRTGATFTFAALEAIKAYWQKTRNPVKAVVLSYTVGKSSSGPWEVADRAEQLFGADKVEFGLLTNEKMVRVTGIKQCSVPVALKEFVRLADCRLRFLDTKREEIRQGYRNLEIELQTQGWTHAGYGTVFLNLPGK